VIVLFEKGTLDGIGEAEILKGGQKFSFCQNSRRPAVRPGAREVIE
jgi:hypothetical protein